ncbi:MAG: tRNA 2-thiocytidine(32) synthetase TtcA [Vicinamibacterales bacterium]
MSYRTPLENRVAKKVTQAIVEHKLIESGDRVMVGLSGGKDSWALMEILHVLQKRAPIDFSIVAVNVNSGYTGFRHDLVTGACAERGWEVHIEHTTIGAIMDDVLEDGDTPCSLCARLRRGVLYRLAAAHGATKIALGHHMDDFVETALLNLFFQGTLKAMPARLVSDNKQHVVIRPLVYVSEAEARAYTEEVKLPVIGCCCPACGDLSLKRQRMKRLITELEVEHPDIKQSMLKALSNVVPSHLLDRTLNSPPQARPRGDSHAAYGPVRAPRPDGTVIPAD